MSVVHSTFVIERTYDATPAQVFAAWANPAAKKQWFAMPEEWTSTPHTLDFRVGGVEEVAGGTEGSPTFTYRATYQDIVPDERIITTYEMHQDDVRLSVSLASVQFESDAGGGTLLTYTEHGAFLDGNDTPESRQQGTEMLLDNLATHLKNQGNS